MTDDDNTPPLHLVTDDEHWERESSALDRIARILEHMAGSQQQSVASLVASRDAGRKILWLVIPALVGALGTVLVFSAEKIATSSERAGKLEATVDGLKERVSKQDAAIAQLLEVLLRRGAALEPHKPPTSDTDHAVPDWMSLLDQRASGTPASTIGVSGRVDRHVPKLQYGHGLVRPLLHSWLELQTDPHSDRGTTSAGRLGAGDALQAAMTTSTRMILSIPEM